MISKSRKKLKLVSIRWAKLISISMLIGFFSALLAISLKTLTEHFEQLLFEKSMASKLMLAIFPLVGLTAISFLRRFLFRNKQNKGITEVFDSIATGKSLPAYKIPSHFINGFLTVIFGGATGIEVSTVVSSAAVGSVVHKKQYFLRKYKTEMMCAGIASGLTALFGSPLAGMLFSLEVVSRKKSSRSLLIPAFACLPALFICDLFSDGNLFQANVTHWNLYALPYMAVFALFAALNAVYMTKVVLWFKSKSSIFSKAQHKILAAAIILGAGLLFLPQLYGDGYLGVKHLISDSGSRFSISLVALLISLLITKPILTAVALWGGGDGGVFAPSLVVGAIAGLLFALCANHFFDARLIPVNFMLIGMAAVLSAAIWAPLTAVFLVCGITGNYILLLPLLLASAVSGFSARKICPYTVYTYKPTN